VQNLSLLQVKVNIRWFKVTAGTPFSKDNLSFNLLYANRSFEGKLPRRGFLVGGKQQCSNSALTGAQSVEENAALSMNGYFGAGSSFTLMHDN
jgi:hypothetical protein